MKKVIGIFLAIFVVCLTSFAQKDFPSDPDSAIFLTSDIDNFWKAFEDFKKDSTTNPFGAKYIDVGSQGVKGFIPYRIQNAAHFVLYGLMFICMD